MSNNAIAKTRPQTNQRRQFMTISLLALGAAIGDWRSFAATDEAMSMSEHEHHHHMMNSGAPVKRSVADYKVPAVKLVRNDGATVAFPQEIDDGRPVILNFIYTSCTTICPLTSQVLSYVQGLLERSHDNAHIVSISIDPEYDTPARLTAYAEKYHAGGRWQHYTGTLEASIAMQKAFNAYRGDKMNHTPLTFLRSAPGKTWVRLDGFANPDEVVGEFHKLVAAQ